MADDTWKYVENQFDNATKESRKRLKAIGQHHRDALSGSTLANKAALISRLDAARLPFEAKYDAWLNLRAELKGAVLVYQQRLDQLSSADIEDIDVAIKGIYKRSTPEYAQLFPRGREPFQEGPNDERVEALENLLARLQALDNDATVPAETLVQEVMVPLRDAREVRTRVETRGEQARTQLEPLRKALAVALYKNLGALMETLGDNPEEVTAFFDLEKLRQTGEEEEDPEPVTPPTPPAGGTPPTP